jgi:hypothetical protein
MMWNLPPERPGPYSPGGWPRSHLEMTDDDEEYLRFLCEEATHRGDPSAAR